jgi:hypothetical protein
LLLLLWARSASRARGYERVCNNLDNELIRTRGMLEAMAKEQANFVRASKPAPAPPQV